MIIIRRGEPSFMAGFYCNNKYNIASVFESQCLLARICILTSDCSAKHHNWSRPDSKWSRHNSL